MSDDPTRDNHAKGLREALWIALFFAQQLRDTTTRDRLCELWRDVVRDPESTADVAPERSAQPGVPA